MATTTTLTHPTGDLSHQNPVSLHHLGSLTHLKADGNLYAYSVSGDNSNDLILYANSDQPRPIHFLLDGNNANGVGSSSSHESMTNLLDEGLGTSLDGTDEISTISSAHSLIGRNDSGVFTGDEAGAVGVQQDAVHQEQTPSPCLAEVTTTSVLGGHASPIHSETETETSMAKKQWAKSLSPNRQGPQRCTVCGKSFSNASALTKHKLTHSDERKHGCSMCGKAFKRQDHLNGHMLTHRNKKPFECSVKGCGKSYCDARSLRRHIESRHGNSTGASRLDHPESQPAKAHLKSSEGRVKSKKKPKTINPSLPIVSTTFSSPQIETKSFDILTEDVLKISNESPNNTAVFHSVSNDLESTPNRGSVRELAVPSGNKYVMVKLKDKLMMTTPSGTNGDNPPTPNLAESLILHNNNNNILMTPETIATILSNAIVQETTKLTNDLLKVSIPANSATSQSQLHQLLTQRSSTTVPVTSAASASLPSPGASKGQSIGTEFQAKWDTSKNEHKLVDYDPRNHKDETPTDGNVEIGTSISKFPNVTPTMGTGSTTTEVTPPPPSPSKTKSHPPALISSSCGGSGGKSSRSGTLSSTSPALLKEQLELIHQIIQQAQEECVNNSSLPKSKTFKGKKSKSTSTAAILQSSNTLGAESKAPTSKGSLQEMCKFGVGSLDDKPVECTICFRRFKNTPALNGHMRLHGGFRPNGGGGGYFKGGKDSDGKRKDSGSNSKDSSLNSTLQTASISVRALIEEKIIQKRNTSSLSASTKRVEGATKTSLLPLSEGSSPVVLTVSSPCGSVGNSGNAGNTGNTGEVTSSISASVVTSFATSSSNVTTQETHSGLDEESDETFGFIYSQEDQDTSEYLLKDLEEEVFNKVSSICPESFLDGIIDESILSGGNNGSEHLMGTEWSWSSSSTASTTANGNTRFHSLYNTIGATGSTDEGMYPYVKMEGTEHADPLTPQTLAALDRNVFYMSPTPQSPSIKSQDSPAYPYPTPPASLESHPALQSPLFSFGSSGGSIGPSGGSFYGFEHMTSCDAMTINMMEMTGGGGSEDCKLFATDSVDEIVLSLGKAIKRDVGTLISMSRNSEDHLGAEKMEDSGLENGGNGKALFADAEQQLLTPSSSPQTNLGPGSPPLLSQSSCGSVVTELKINEASQMETQQKLCVSLGQRLDVFLNPNRVRTTSNSYLKSAKRKQVRNTFASNLRHFASPVADTSGTQAQVTSCHFTPYPILSPVRSAPGLYWTFSNKLSHVDDSTRECPKINVGLSFQATNLPHPAPNSRKRKATEDDEVQILEPNEQNSCNEDDVPLWDPSVTNNCSTDEVEKYLEFACCSAVPGGGRNKEYALHLLNHCNGDINAAIILLMNPQPQVPSALRNYTYSDNAKWTPSELISFQDGLLKHGKDFRLVAGSIPSKTRPDCINFYHLWKKICSLEYEKIRNIWKKREAAFTLDLLKSVPPNSPFAHAHIEQGKEIDSSENSNQKVPAQIDIKVNNGQTDFVNGLSFQAHEDYPCKICGKVFTKVKSRSAHMKSHRPPDQQQSDQALTPFQRKSKINFSIPLDSSAPLRVSTKSSGSLGSKNLEPPPPLLEVGSDVRVSSNKDRNT